MSRAVSKCVLMLLAVTAIPLRLLGQYAGGNGDGAANKAIRFRINDVGSVIYAGPRSPKITTIQVWPSKILDTNLAGKQLFVVDNSGKSLVVNFPNSWQSQVLPVGLYLVRDREEKLKGRLIVLP